MAAVQHILDRLNQFEGVQGSPPHLSRCRARLLWVVTDQHPAHPGSFLARPHNIDNAGGQALEMALIASILEQLHGLLAKGLVRDERASFWPPEVLEMWSVG